MSLLAGASSLLGCPDNSLGDVGEDTQGADVIAGADAIASALPCMSTDP